MPTPNYRINVLLSKDARAVLVRSAKRDRIPTATKAAQLLELALDIEEDALFDLVASNRDSKAVRYLRHTEAW
ncbi:hypothetical protein HYW32_02790 [Candidatus Berkelbacteria bacterium]|nr:hypothetical protein [Candidatus Berkelbacteria bacterium]